MENNEAKQAKDKDIHSHRDIPNDFRDYRDIHSHQDIEDELIVTAEPIEVPYLIHSTHRILHHRGFSACIRCGAMASSATRRAEHLADSCLGQSSMSSGTRSRLRQHQRGEPAAVGSYGRAGPHAVEEGDSRKIHSGWASGCPLRRLDQKGGLA